MLLQGNPLYKVCILLKPIAYSCNLVQDTNCGVQPCGTCAVHALLIEKRALSSEERRKGRGGVHLLLHHTSFARWRWVERGPNTFHSAQASRFHPSADVFTLYLGSNRHFYSFFKKSFAKKKFFLEKAKKPLQTLLPWECTNRLGETRWFRGTATHVPGRIYQSLAAESRLVACSIELGHNSLCPWNIRI